MEALLSKFPHLDHLLNAYLHQDWRLFGGTLEDVIKIYARDVPVSETKLLGSEIHQFILSEGDSLEKDYYILYPNSVLPSGWQMSVRDWLLHIAKLAGEQLPRR